MTFAWSMPMKTVSRSLWLVLLALLPSLPVGAAEVFKCIDAKGHAVFSESPCPDSAVSSTALPQQVFHSLRALVDEGEKINADLKEDVESIKQCNQSVVKLKQKLEALRPEVEKVAFDHRFLYAALDQAMECAQCRVSAIAYCKKADSYLDKSMNGLIGKRKKGV
jgi:hypothetical protein